MCRLRVFEIYIHFNYETMHGLKNLLSFLMRSLCMSLTSPATLEHLKFHINIRGQETNSNYFDFFDILSYTGPLDSISTLPTASRLQRVDIIIDYCLRASDYHPEPDEDEVVETVLDSLPLLRTKGILFVEAVVRW